MIDKIRYIIGQLLITAGVRIMTRDQVLRVVEVFAGIDKDLKVQRFKDHLSTCSACASRHKRMSN